MKINVLCILAIFCNQFFSRALTVGPYTRGIVSGGYTAAMEMTCLPDIDEALMESIIAENVEIVETVELMEDLDFSMSDQHSPDSTIPSPTPLLPPCRVCGEKASGFHYGANTCEACKGFFRRSLVKAEKNQEDYKCNSGGQCKIQPGRRNACASCRYKKCLSVGMSKHAIKTGRYTYEKRTRDTNEVKKLQGIDHRHKDSRTNLNIEDAEVMLLISTLAEVQRRVDPEFIKIFDPEYTLQRQKSLYENYMERIDLFGNLSVIPNDMYDEFYKETGIEIDDRKQLMTTIAQKMEKGVQNMVEFLKALPGLDNICINDQSKLIKAGYFEFWFLIQHKLVNTDLNVYCGCVDIHKDEYKAIFGNPQAIEEMFSLAKKFQNLNLSEEEVALVRGIVLTFTDRCNLEEPHKVEKIQWRLISCLQWLSRRNNHNPEQRFCKILDRLTALRSLTEINNEINKEKLKWPVMQNHPLVMDVIS